MADFGHFIRRKGPVFITTYARLPKLQNLHASFDPDPAPPNLLNNIANSENSPVTIMGSNTRITLNSPFHNPNVGCLSDLTEEKIRLRRWLRKSG
jgi:hypothetical protein